MTLDSEQAEWGAVFSDAYEAGHDVQEAANRAQWATRHWWSEGDSHALDLMHPWAPSEDQP